MRRRRSSPPARPRGFALPMVLLLGVISTILITVMLSRHATQSLMVARERERTVNRHFERGLAECLDQWLAMLGSKPVGEALGEDGRAFTISTRGSAVDFSLKDAQGSLLGDPVGLSAVPRRTALQALANLRATLGSLPPDTVRPVGPLAVSANSASMEALTAILQAALQDESAGESLAREIVSRRPLAAEDLTAVLGESGLEPPQQEIARRVLVTASTLWRFTIEPQTNRTRPPGGRIRYQGLVLVGAAKYDPQGFQRKSAILSMEKELY